MIFSILIPTKDYTKGLKRILENIPEKNLNIKIIISDDSSNNKIKNYITKLDKKNITYIKNQPRLGLAKNWNQLLSLCKSKYFMYLHNDDYITQKDFFANLFRIIKNKNYPQVLSVKTKIVNNKSNSEKWHIKYFLRNFLYNMSKKYILRRNFIGPVSSLVIKNNNLPKFDTKLRWLVDADFYYKLINKKKIKFTDELFICAEYNSEFSQHHENKGKISALNKKEFYYILKKYHFNNKSIFIIKFFEPIFWVMIRVVNCLL